MAPTPPSPAPAMVNGITAVALNPFATLAAAMPPISSVAPLAMVVFVPEPNAPNRSLAPFRR